MKLPELDEKYLVFALIFMMGNHLQRAGDSLYEEITSKQWFVFAALEAFDNDMPPTLKELSAVMGSSHQNVKQLVLKLEEKGYVTTEKDLADKRQIRICGTKKIAEFGQKYSEEQTKFMNGLYENLSKDELKTTLRTLLQMKNNIEGME